MAMLQAVLDTIPHRPPFLFLDRIDEIRADGATCSRTFRADEPFYSGHYPGNPITPGVLLCESVFQAGAIFLTKKLQSAGGAPAGKTPVLCRIEEAKFKGMVQPGDTVMGSLPVNLAAQVCAKGAAYWHLSVVLPLERRGQELSADELERLGAHLQLFHIVLKSEAS